MKKLLTLAVALGLASQVFGYEQRTIVSSFTATTDTLATIPNANTLERVAVGKGTTSGTITLYDSKGTATNKIITIDLATIYEYDFEIKLSSGLTYTTATNTNGTLITYTK